MMTRSLFTLLFIVATLPVQAAYASEKQQDITKFVEEVFAGEVPQRQKLKLSIEMKAQLKEVLGHKMRGSRVRYWEQDSRTVWVLEEIGKTRPITTGLVINDSKLEQLKVIKFRESRGGEIRYPFFTDQFKGVGIDENNKLDTSIDGISGATLSVRAMKKLSRVAIILHNHVQEQPTIQE